tara:strand:+ start:6191 stop:6700 length:510 start_codon:yes stop_codon:yes gene_type:complete
MSGQSRWWAIPGALLVLTGVLALAENQRQPGDQLDPGGASATDVVPQPESDGMIANGSDVVMARDASGERQPMAFGQAVADQALILVMPANFAGKLVDVTLWRRLDNQREAEPWIRMRPLVRSDATLPMAGIVPGAYDIEVGLPDEPRLLIENTAAPGEVRFVAATPVR